MSNLLLNCLPFRILWQIIKRFLTLVSKKIRIDPSRQNEISSLLNKKKFMIFNNEHAFWRAKSNNLTIIFYKNGSVFFQGDGNEILSILNEWERFLPLSQEEFNVEFPVIGLDESGKGDYFGPLVLAAAILDSLSEKEAVKTGVMDSKKITDHSIRKIYFEIKDSIEHRVRIIEPCEYNNLYKKFGNVNLLMFHEYTELVRQFDSKSYKTLILDKFSGSEVLNRKFRESMNCETVIVEKGERFPAVAAASIFARFSFLNWIENKSIHSKITLPRGSGYDASMLFMRLKSEMPAKEFENLAKTHFKAHEN